MRALRLVRSIVLLSLGLAIFACGGSSSSAPGAPAPFNAAKGEGVLASSSSAVTYLTGATGAAAANPSPLPALNEYYTNAICPGIVGSDQCAQNEANLNTPQFGNFDLSKDPIANNPIRITEIDGIAITYGALNVGGALATLSGAVLIPKSNTFKGIVLYFHDTVVQRSQVPSNFITASNLTGDSDGMLLAATWASQGYIVAMPDYIGLGVDTAEPHPYMVYPRQNAQSGLAMVKAVRDYLADKHHLPLYITGYSEGGAYALQAGHLMQDNPRYASALKVHLKNVTPISGALDTSGSQFPFLLDDVNASGSPWFIQTPLITNFEKPFLTADVALSFSNYANIAPTDVMASAFYNCNPFFAKFCGNDGTLNGLYYQTTTLNDGAILFVTLLQAALAGYLPSNAVTPLFTPTYAEQLMNHDTSNPLYAALLAADTYLFTPRFPLALLSLDLDSVVTRVNSDVAFAYMSGKNPKGPYQEILIDNNDFQFAGSGPIDHLNALPFLAIAALNQFNLNP